MGYKPDDNKNMKYLIAYMFMFQIRITELLVLIQGRSMMLSILMNVIINFMDKHQCANWHCCFFDTNFAVYWAFVNHILIFIWEISLPTII
jgi:hypothetical protein